jgi:hypothetical protein
MTERKCCALDHTFVRCAGGSAHWDIDWILAGGDGGTELESILLDAPELELHGAGGQVRVKVLRQLLQKMSTL